MNPRRYLQQALRQPGGLLGLLQRVLELGIRGELPQALRRATRRGFSPAEYRRWTSQHVVTAPRGRTASRWLVLVDTPGATLVQDAAHARFAVTLARTDPGWRGSVDVDDWLLWIAEPVEVEPALLEAFDAAATMFPDARVIYCDDDERVAGIPGAPRFKPAWDRDYFTQRDYVGRVLALHGSLVAGYAGEALQLGDRAAVTRAWPAQVPDRAVLHVPRVLVHRLSSAGEPTPGSGSAQALADPSGVRVSIVVPTRDRVDLLRRCLDSLPRPSPAVEWVVVDNDSREHATFDYLADIEATIVRVPGAFNFPRLVNAGARAARGQVLVFLNNDAMLPRPDALDELVALARAERTGAVGPLLVYEDGTIQSAGVFLGVNRTASNVLAGYPRAHPVALDWCRARRRVSAVNGACLVVRQAVFETAGGFDESFAVSHNELDFCLKLAEAGLANLFVPSSVVVHSEGASRGREIGATDRQRLASEERLFVERWGHRLAACDPAHNPNLAARGDPFSLSPAPAAHPARRPGPLQT